MIVVVDFDGTLALGDTSDIETMSPNVSIISLINQMYFDGNVINVVTARGSKSCNSLKEKEEKYLTRLKKWLEKYNVKYHNISFNKEYADVYIDDRCFNIKETFFYEKLDTNFTQNKVRRFNDIVVKKTESSINEFNWYKHASDLGIKTPTILNYDIDTIATSFINGKICKNFNLISNTIQNFKKNSSKNGYDFINYINRIKKHLENNNGIINGNRLIENLNKITVPSSFNHGDFSVYNIIEFNDNIYLIDPIFSSDLFQSYYIDIAKHLFSILYYLFDYELYEYFYYNYVNKFLLDEKILNVLIVSESVRVANRNNKFYSVSNNLIDSLT